MSDKKVRNMKVYSQSGYKYQEVPSIILRGKWLASAGFEIGDHITVSCEDGKITITPDAERAELVKAEAAFMEKELKSLQKRFEQEKAKLRVQFVAESVGGYGG